MSGILGKIKSLFSGSGSAEAPRAEKVQEIGGYRVYATPLREGAQFRLAGRIEHDGEAGKMVRTFIRADLFSSEDDTVETTFRKAKQIIDQNGQGLFGDGVAARNV